MLPFEDDSEELERNEPDSSDESVIENEDSAEAREAKENLAKSRGWKPKDEYRGREEDWQEADEFLDRNSSLQSEVRELRDTISQQEAEYAERLRRIEAANERIIQNDRERLLKQLDEAKRQAVELGDVEQYDRVRSEESEYYKREAEFNRRLERDTQRQEQPKLLPETQDWLRRNSWYHESQAMHQIARGFYDEALEGMPALRDESKRLAYVDRKMREVYPDKFGLRSNSSAVESGARRPGTPSKMASLTPAERDACKKFIQRGIIKDEAEYIRYLNEQ